MGEIKYEAVFGPQELFNNEFEPNAIAVIFIDRTNKLHATSEAEIDRQLQRTGSYVVAMRRIIKTPVWTVADQQAGRLPEAGSLIMEVESQDSFEFVGVCAGSKRFAVKDVLDGLIYFYNKDVISPIETPAEKAQRERDEWIDNACSFICFYDIGRVDAIKSLEITYDKLKSGELPPVQAKDGA